jgi:hypothetical protein
MDLLPKLVEFDAPIARALASIRHGAEEDFDRLETIWE